MWLSIGRGLLWFTLFVTWLLLVGAVLEGLVWVVRKATGFELSLKGSPMYADWNFINWQWTATKGAIVNDTEDKRLFQRQKKRTGGAFMPFLFRFVWGRDTLHKEGYGPIVTDDTDRVKAQEAYRKVVEFKDTAKPRMTKEERLLAAIVKALNEVNTAERKALETGQEESPDGSRSDGEPKAAPDSGAPADGRHAVLAAGGHVPAALDRSLAPRTRRR